MAKKKSGTDTIAENRRARFEYDIHETIEAGLVLKGTEVKSLRAGKASLAEAFAMVRRSEAWLLQAHIPEYEFGNYANHDPTRMRKLLMHRSEIEKCEKFTQEQGRTLVPLRMYWQDGTAKVLIGLGTGKARHDKRADMAKRDADREMQRAIKERSR